MSFSNVCVYTRLFNEKEFAKHCSIFQNFRGCFSKEVVFDVVNMSSIIQGKEAVDVGAEIASGLYIEMNCRTLAGTVLSGSRFEIGFHLERWRGDG